MFDILIQNGLICDGTGRPSYQADIGITGDKITDIGNLENQTAAKIIDAAGKTVTPGFIDPHTHVDLSVLEEPAMEPYLRQALSACPLAEIRFTCRALMLPTKKFTAC